MMGTRYYIYAEIQVNNKWYNLNPIMKKHDGSLVVRPIYDGASGFYDVYCELDEHRISSGLPEDMSTELRSVFHSNF